MNSVLTSHEDLVLVVGATGGVGQLVVSKLIEKGLSVRILVRNLTKAEKMFGNQVEFAVGDILVPNTLSKAMQNVSAIICCTGTTAFPSQRWEFDQPPNFIELVVSLFNPEYSETKAKNTPIKVDAEGVKNLVLSAPNNLKRFIFVSSCGIRRKKEFPFVILNRFGVLDAKQQGEEAIIHSGLPYTIIRPGRLIDGPYTSYDLNTLLKAETKGKLAVVLGRDDQLIGDASRIDVADACVESLFSPHTVGQIFELVNQGKRPAVIDWQSLFKQM